MYASTWVACDCELIQITLEVSYSRETMTYQNPLTAGTPLCIKSNTKTDLEIITMLSTLAFKVLRLLI